MLTHAVQNMQDCHVGVVLGAAMHTASCIAALVLQHGQHLMHNGCDPQRHEGSGFAGAQALLLQPGCQHGLLLMGQLCLLLLCVPVSTTTGISFAYTLTGRQY